MTRISLAELVKSIKCDLDFAKENARLSSDVECFSDQQEYWEAKAEALQKVLDGIEKTHEFANTILDKKEDLLKTIKRKLAVFSK
jgi:hypothetical protein